MAVRNISQSLLFFQEYIDRNSYFFNRGIVGFVPGFMSNINKG